MDFLQEFCSIPTAPFLEHRVIDHIKGFAAKRKLSVKRDPAGNMLIEAPGKKKLPRWVFQAHMDHPGVLARSMLDGKIVDAEFRGGVFAEYAQGTRIRFFDGEKQIVGIVTEAIGMDGRLRAVKVRVPKPVSPGSLGMFDQGEGRVRGTKFYCRGCDDMAGVAAAMSMLDQIARKPAESPVAVLLTRAEEVGFVGTIAGVRHGKLLRKTDRLINIECSAEQPYAQQGNGVILRTGDATSVFNSSLTFFMHQQAKALAKKDKAFKFQRCLMPGGSCEATVYDVYGFMASAVCVPLRNYHNMDKAAKKIGPEYIDLNDWKSEVKLFVHLVRNGHKYAAGHVWLRKYFMEEYKELEKLLY